MRYRLAAEGVLLHTSPMYPRLSAWLAQARRGGRFPDLIDTVRQVHVLSAWPSADAFVAEMPTWFRLDRTAGQERALYVAAEKDLLRQQLTGWLKFAGTPVRIARGFGSQSYADVVRDRVDREQREAHLVVVGVFDCSGEDIERDWVERARGAAHPRAGPRVRAPGGRGQTRRPEVAGLRPPLRQSVASSPSSRKVRFSEAIRSAEQTRPASYSPSMPLLSRSSATRSAGNGCPRDEAHWSSADSDAGRWKTTGPGRSPTSAIHTADSTSTLPRR
ncbi:hypothetical protein [Streptomyces sp. NPDC085665]|uniref:hypothetical protein n=1 Tax=Streptomyces sp. NPDC085665 TaxID=3365735 RepID=UPI0037D74768